MKTLYFELNMGAAGDMLMASLIDLHPDPDGMVEKINQLGIPGVTVVREASVKCGITGTHMRVTVHGEEEESCDVHGHAHDHEHEHDHEHSHDHEHEHHHDHDHVHEHKHHHDHGHEHEHEHHHEHTHSHHGMRDIETLIRALPVSAVVAGHALEVYRLIAEAESHAHGAPVDQIHFHEVGSMDAVADIVGFCLLMEDLAPDRVLASPVHVGSGHVRCAHGILPVPAPATAHILRDVPIYSGAIRGELATPTGAALIKHFAEGFGPMPPIKVSRVGYGMGKKDFEAANCVRAFLGEAAAQTPDRDEIASLICNLDDMTPEMIGFALDALMEAGALDAFTAPIGMKKSRPGTLLTCLCRPEDADRLAEALFKNTTTLGIRKEVQTRYILKRKTEERETAYGPVRVKSAEGYGVRREKLEYDDLARIAKERGISLTDLIKEMK